VSPRAVRLNDTFYLPRLDEHGREVRDVMPWEGAVSYATDGKRIGIQYPDRVEWLGDALAVTGTAEPASHAPSSPAGTGAFVEDFEGIDLDALLGGIRTYMERHPILKTVWRDDLDALERLRALSRPSDRAS
jgi:hypothetical protein